MNAEILLGLAAILAAVALLIRAFASRTTTDNAKDALVVSLAAKSDDLYEKMYASALREVVSANEKAASIATLTIVQSKLDIALADLTIVRAQLKLANEQITRLLQLQPSTSPQDHASNIAADRASEHTAVAQEVPPLTVPPSPINAIDGVTGEGVKVA